MFDDPTKSPYNDEDIELWRENMSNKQIITELACALRVCRAALLGVESEQIKAYGAADFSTVTEPINIATEALRLVPDHKSN